jgi:hypothetical protein
MASDYQSLRNALLMGGADASTLDVLVNSSKTDARQDSVVADGKCYHAKPTTQTRTYVSLIEAGNASRKHRLTSFNSTSWNFNNRKTSGGNAGPARGTPWRPVNYDTSLLDDTLDNYDADNMTDEEIVSTRHVSGQQNDQPQRTLFFSGLSERTTYRDLMSVIKGGKIISSVLRNNSALVTFATGAAEFLAWSKRNDTYLQGKRVSVVAFQSREF